MATDLQKAVALKISENIRTRKRQSKGEVLTEVGYAETTTKRPSQVFESIGFKEELAKYGLTDELIINSLAKDIKSKPRNRVQELRLAADITGLNKKGDTNINVGIFSITQVLNKAKENE